MNARSILTIFIVSALFCASALKAQNQSLAQLEERITAEMEALIDKTGQISEEDGLACRQLIQQGVREHDNGEYRKAIELYEKALKKNPLSYLAYYEMAYSYSASGDQEKGLEFTLRSLALNPKSEDAFVMKANILDDMGRQEDAISVYRKLIEIKPDSYSAHLNLGISLIRKGELDQATSEFMKAHEVAPEHPSPFYQLSRVAKLKGENYEEERFLKEFVRVGKSDGRMPAVEQRLKELQTANININVDSKNALAGPKTMIAIMEGGTRALWRQEKHRKTFPDAKAYSPSFEEELDVINTVLSVWKKEKEKDPELADPVYDLAAASEKAGYLNEYVWHMNRGKLGKAAETWFKENSKRASEFVEWASKSGFQNLVKDEAESGAPAGNSTIGIRDLPAVILKAASDSKLTYQIGAGTPEEGVGFRKRESARFKNAFKQMSGQCVAKEEARAALKTMASGSAADIYIKVIRAFLPGDEEWDSAMRRSSLFGSRYRDLAPSLQNSGAIEKKDNKILVKTVNPSWIPYYMAKALWRYEPGFRQRFGGPDDDKPSIAEEKLAMAVLVGALINASESKDSKAEPDPYMDMIREAYAENHLSGFLLLEILHKTYGVSLECLTADQDEAVKNYFFSFVMERVRPADK